MLVNLRTVKADDDFSVYFYNRHSKLSAFLDYLLSPFGILSQVNFLVFYTLGFKIFFGHVAEVTGRRRVYKNVIHILMLNEKSISHDSLISKTIHTSPVCHLRNRIKSLLTFLLYLGPVVLRAFRGCHTGSVNYLENMSF